MCLDVVLPRGSECAFCAEVAVESWWKKRFAAQRERQGLLCFPCSVEQKVIGTEEGAKDWQRRQWTLVTVSLSIAHSGGTFAFTLPKNFRRRFQSGICDLSALDRSHQCDSFPPKGQQKQNHILHTLLILEASHPWRPGLSSISLVFVMCFPKLPRSEKYKNKGTKPFSGVPILENYASKVTWASHLQMQTVQVAFDDNAHSRGLLGFPHRFAGYLFINPHLSNWKRLLL